MAHFVPARAQRSATAISTEFAGDVRKAGTPWTKSRERFAGCRDRRRAIESSAAARPAETTDLINQIHVLQVAAGVARRFLDVRSDEARAAEHA